MFMRPTFRQAFRSAYFRGAVVCVPVLAMQALLLAWGGEAAWALLPVAVILVLSTAYTVVVHAADHRPIAATAVPVAFAVGCCLVMAAGFGAVFGFHYLLIALLPLALAWEKAGDAGRWGAALALCLLVLWIEAGSGDAFVPHDDTIGRYVGLFRTVNLASAILLLAAFIRIALDFKAEDLLRAGPSTPPARTTAGLPERRRLADGAHRPYLHFIEPDRVFSVIMLEIDHHAALSEIFGRATAEHVTRQASALIVGKVRETDMLSRRGHSAFLIFLPETVEEEAYAVAERIRVAIAEAPLAAGGPTLKVSATLGVAQSSSSADVTAAIAEAERAVAAGHDRSMLAGLL